MQYVRQWLPVIAGLISSILLQREGVSPKIAHMTWIVIWMAGWWILESVHLAITALLPLVLYPLMGIMDMKTCSEQYMEQTIFLFIGGFFIGFTLEKWRLHEWFSGWLIQITGRTPGRLLLGIMVSTFFLSMWISNTAATLLLLSVVAGFCQTGRGGLNTALLLGLTYSATIGGMASLVGSPTNMVLPAFYDQVLHEENRITFSTWLQVGLPFAVVLLCVCWIILYLLFLRKESGAEVAVSPPTFLDTNQKRVMMLFLLTAGLWIFRSDLDLGVIRIPGWSGWLQNGSMIKDSTIAIAMSLFLFLWPAKGGTGNLLQWKDVAQLPLDVILLFGGGFALSAGFQESGLSSWLGTHLQILGQISFPLLLLILALFTTILSEFTSNVATIQLVLPIILPLAQAGGQDPFYVLMAISIAASFGFMMPIATAPNTLVYSTGKVSNRDMIHAGVRINLAAIVWLVLYISFIRG